MKNHGFFIIDFDAIIWYNTVSIFGYSENTKTVAVASLCGKMKFLFAFPRGEVMWMKLELEEVLMIISLIFVLLNYINNIYKKK